MVLAIVIHSLLGYAIARNKRSKFYKFIYLYVVSGMFVPFAILDVYKRQGQDAMQMEISLKNHEDTSIIRPKM